QNERAFGHGEGHSTTFLESFLPFALAQSKIAPLHHVDHGALPALRSLFEVCGWPDAQRNRTREQNSIPGRDASSSGRFRSVTLASKGISSIAAFTSRMASP